MSRSNDIAGLTTSILDGVTATEVGLGNVTNESKATMFTSPTFTGTVSGVTAGHITSGTLGNTVQDNITRLGTVTTGTIGTGVTQPPRHNFLAYKDGNQTVDTSTTVQVSFQTDAFSSWDGTYGFDISNDRYVAPETGVYYIYFSGRITDGADAGGGSIWKLAHNETLATNALGSASIKNFGSLIKEASQYVPDTHAMRVISLTQGDYLRLYCRNMTGGQEAIMNTSDGFQCTVMGGFMLR